MKIGFVLFNTPAQSETFITSKLKGLQENGFKVVLFAKEKEKFDLCKVVPHPKISRFIIIQLIQMMTAYGILFFNHPIIFFRFLYREKKDGISISSRWKNLYLNNHILKEKLNWLHFGFITTAIRRENVAHAIGAKMGVSLRGYDICIYPLKNPGCYKKVWEKVDKVHSISNDLLDASHKQGLSDIVPQSIIHPAINVDYFNPGEKIWGKINGEEIIHLLTISRLHWKKGLEYTIQALAILKEKNISFQYTIIGEGKERERLMFVTHQMGLNDSITFAGSIPHQDIIKYYKEADIYLQYSTQEGFCNAVLEAQAMGLITIVSDAEGLPENVIDGETGWVVGKRNRRLLAEKIMDIISLDVSELNKIRKNAINRVNKEFNLATQKKRFLNFYQN